MCVCVFSCGTLLGGLGPFRRAKSPLDEYHLALLNKGDVGASQHPTHCLVAHTLRRWWHVPIGCHTPDRWPPETVRRVDTWPPPAVNTAMLAVTTSNTFRAPCIMGYIVDMAQFLDSFCNSSPFRLYHCKFRIFTFCSVKIFKPLRFIAPCDEKCCNPFSVYFKILKIFLLLKYWKKYLKLALFEKFQIFLSFLEEVQSIAPLCLTLIWETSIIQYYSGKNILPKTNPFPTTL